jgi:hypothetical protein
MVVGALRRVLQPATAQDQAGVPRVRVQARSGSWLTLHGAWTTAPGGRGDEIMDIIEPSRAHELAWLRASAYGLSERERAVRVAGPSFRQGGIALEGAGPNSSVRSE